MKKFILMTQDNCPKCERLKLMLAKPMKGMYDDRIEIVHRQTNPEKFMELAAQFNVQATPTLISIADSASMTDISSGPKIAKFLDS